ncbi:MAG: amino acid adenylation domain-containing protein [Myxococcales bacterium]
MPEAASDPSLLALDTAQERWWLLAQLVHQSPALYIAHAVRRPSGLPLSELTTSVVNWAEGIPALKALVEGSGERARRRVGPQAHVSVRTIGSPLALATAAAHEVRAEAKRGISLERGPLLRVTQIVAPDGVALVFVSHRVVASRELLASWCRPLEGQGAHARAAGNDATRALSVSLERERAFLASPEAKAHGQSVATRLRGHELSLDLPTDRVRAEERDLVSSELVQPLSAACRSALGQLAAQTGASSQDVLSAALALMLARYARQRDLVLGEVLPSDPSDPGAREPSAILRLNLEGRPSVSQLVERVARARVEARADAPLPFEALLGQLALKRDPSRSPIFQVEFRHRTLAQEALIVDAGGLELDLSFDFLESPGALTCVVRFATQLFDAASVARMVAHLGELLCRMAAAPDREAFRLQMVTDQERSALLGPATNLPAYSASPAIHRWVEARAKERPEALAITCNGESLSYGALNRRANQLARALVARGVGRDQRVVVCMERSLDLVVALLAVLKAGGAYVPIEPTNPKDRIDFVLEDARAILALTQRPLADKVSGSDVLFVDDLGAFAQHAEGDLEGPDVLESLAYVIYTSGSTGKPKGCLIEHRHVVRLFQACDAWFHFGPDDVFSVFHSFAFDFSVFELWGALMFGGRAVVVPQSVTRAPDDFLSLCVREKVSVLCQTPSAFRQFVANEAKLAPGALALRLVVFGGEALELESLRPWFQKHGDSKPELVNMYGITETTVHVTYRPIRFADLALGASSVIGVPIPDLYVHLLDEEQNLVPVGVPGEIHVGGAGVARGYLERPELTAARFVDDPFVPGARLYRSGDLARLLPHGELDYLGRIDFQVKIRGFRIETGEIEAALRRSGLVRDVAVLTHKQAGDAFLAAYVVTDATPNDLRSALRRELPEYMVPSVFVVIPELPMNVNGKVDRAALPEPREVTQTVQVRPSSELERIIASVWCEVLGRDEVSVDQSFFDLGGNSGRVVAVGKRLKELHGIEVPIARLFQHTSVRTLAQHLGSVPSKLRHEAAAARPAAGGELEPIAIVGMAGRFPGAPDVESLWKNLEQGLESVTRFALNELDPSVPESERSSPQYVAARPMLESATLFDAEFFGISPSEADVIDPQQRVMLEVAWEALESAGYDPARPKGSIGVYCGEYNVTYYTENVLTRPDVLDRVGSFVAMVGNEKDYIATRIAHRLDLRGPAISVHTACSTSLVAVAQAFFALRTRQCDMALAGGVSIAFPQRRGHVYEEGGMLCADGHCRPFDANATGTMFGDGAAMLVLKRLSDAQADGDHIHAVIRGAATNNDGAHKMSFSAPTVEGQAEVIAQAQTVAGVDAASIGYVEAHGTATPLGDPIEVEALTQAFRRSTDKRNFCGIGSVKSNLGHLTAASGATGLIKAALSLEHEHIPKSLHFERPNPGIDFANSPFYVMAEPKAWPRGAVARRAGVSSFGVGGTNAHVVIEEAPARAESGSAQEPQLLVLSARSEAALARMGERLGAWLATHPQASLSDVAFTLARGRRHFERRRAVVVQDPAQAAQELSGKQAEAQLSSKTPQVVFVFPGQGAQHAGMGRALYQRYPAFAEALDRCNALLEPILQADLKALMFAPDDDPAAHALLRETRITQPALFAIGYALAQLWKSLGVEPACLIGHSVGEFVAAHLAGVMSLDDALRMVAERGRLLQSMPRGSMLAVRAPAARVEASLDPTLSIAAINGPNLCVVAGPERAVHALSLLLDAQGVANSHLHTSHAFHSAMMDPAVPQFLEFVRKIPLAAPKLPIYSTVSGALLTDSEATDSMYWARHLRATVRFADAVQAAYAEPHRVLLEVGPRNGATQLARQAIVDRKTQHAVATLDGKVDRAELSALLGAVGQLFERGVSVNLTALPSAQGARRVPLPTYPFERKLHFVEPGKALGVPAPQASAPSRGVQADAAPVGDPFAIPATGEDLVTAQLRLMEMQLAILASSNPGDAE